MSAASRFVAFGLAILGMVILSNDLYAQRGGRGGGGFFGRDGGNPMELLGRDSIRKELELLEDQEKDLDDLLTKSREKMMSSFREMRDVPREERGERMQEIMTENNKDFEKGMNEVLLAHQVDRLKQLQVQSRVRRSGAAGALGNDTLKEALDLTEEQLEEIREVAQEAEKEVQKKIQEAREDAQKKILGVLTADQRAKWEEMVGSSFNFDNADDQRRFGGRGGQGRRGGGQDQAGGQGGFGRRGNRGNNNQQD